MHPTLSYAGLFVVFAVFFSYLSLNSFDSTSDYLSLIDHQTPFYSLCLFLCLAIISHWAGNDICRNFGRISFAVDFCSFASFLLHWILKHWWILGI